jgi:hypothetical protein
MLAKLFNDKVGLLSVTLHAGIAEELRLLTTQFAKLWRSWPGLDIQAEK